MNSLPFRQIHLDFHTSGAIEGIGSRFSKEQFQEALKAGHVNSITVFSKCHHGWSYHPTAVNRMHPGLSFDLLKAQLEACAEIGVRAPVYISAGFDEKEVAAHPDWLCWSTPGGPTPEDLGAAHYHLMCYNTPYLDLLAAQVEEVMRLYNPCEIFLDISAVRVCHCPNCRKEMLERGEDPENPADLRRQGERVYARYCERMAQAVHRYNPDTAIFHNAGNIIRGRRDLAHRDTHLELESLPTGGWGYDHFPMSAAYVRGLGMDFLGMTGKFHTTWGEFGGFKHPNALRYEAALSIACGAKCSVGDQLHPDGEMNLSTYRLIGAAYAEIEAKEPWCDHVESVADIGVLSTEAVNGFAGRDCHSDIGANRILLEGKYLYDILDLESDFSKYKLLILPDEIRLNAALTERLSDYLAAGGKILATGVSGLKVNADEFALPFGAEFLGENPFRPNYYIPKFETVNGETAYVMYQQGYRIRPESSATCFALEQDSYFNRTPEHFSSHQHTPNNPDTSAPAAVLTKNTAYLNWKLFSEYAEMGSFHIKELLCYAIDALLDKEKTLTTDLPDRGVTTLMKQEAENRLIHHLLFAYTTNRGQKTEVIQDTIPLYNIHASIKSSKAPKEVYLAPSKDPLPYTYENGIISYTIPKLEIHQMVVIQY